MGLGIFAPLGKYQSQMRPVATIVPLQAIVGGAWEWVDKPVKNLSTARLAGGIAYRRMAKLNIAVEVRVVNLKTMHVVG